MRKQEAEITPHVNKWCLKWLPESTPWDVKHTRGKDRFDLSELYDHQLDYMLAATTPHGFVFKIEDAGYRHPPCDTVMYKNAKNAGFAIVYPETVFYIRALDIELITTPSISFKVAEAIAINSIARLQLPK